MLLFIILEIRCDPGCAGPARSHESPPASCPVDVSPWKRGTAGVSSVFVRFSEKTRLILSAAPYVSDLTLAVI